VEAQGKQYVLKQIHHEPCDYYSFGNKIEAEINDYNRLLQTGINLPKMFDVDITNERIIKEYIDGPTIYQLVLQDGVEEIHFAQMRAMCAVLYPSGLNIDYFPTNFVVQNGKMYYIDYECNGYMDQWNFENWGIGYWSKTPQFLEYARNHGDI
jgi:tRNA A-37 threonylcarbamoyl transferase component Bud32